MAKINVEILSEDPQEIAALEAYWRQSEDGESWAETVAAICSRLGLRNRDLNSIVRRAAIATLPEVACPGCGDAPVVMSRSAVTDALRRPDIQCRPCQAALLAKQQQAEQDIVAQR